MTSSQGKKIVNEVIEEDVISINFKGQFADSDFVQSVQSAKFYKLGESEPLIQVGNQFFKCKPEVIHGTNVYFDIESNERQLKPSTSSTDGNSSTTSNSLEPKDTSSLEYLTKTTKSYVTRRVFLEKKLPDE